MRRRKRRKLNWGPILWLAFIVNTIVGLYVSPATSATIVRVLGAKPTDQVRIEGELQALTNIPCLKVNKAAIRERIYNRPDVHSVDLSANLFGRASLNIRYDQAVALVEGTRSLVLTSSGALASIPDVPGGLPILRINTNIQAPILAYDSTWESANVADVCKRAAQKSLIKDLVVIVKEKGVVCLNSGVTGQVILGAPDKLDEKFAKLEQILAVQPDLLTQQKCVNLTLPSKPQVSEYSGEQS